MFAFEFKLKNDFMIRAKLIVLLIALQLCVFTFSQELKDSIVPANNIVGLEIGGSAFLGSFNYERIFYLSEKNKIATGVSLMAANCYDRVYSTVGHRISYLYGKKHHLEIGGTYNLFAVFDDKSGAQIGGAVRGLTAKVGYRYQKPEGGLMFSASALLFNCNDVSSGFSGSVYLPWFALGMGWGF